MNALPGGAAPPSRIATLDAVRGVAVMGILLLNIVSFALPAYAYVDPNFAGGASGANWWAWASIYVLADGKMRGLFTMLFGASTLLVAERALAGGASPARVHHARMTSLFAIGLVHAYLIWAGDILTLYAVCGALLFAVWRWPARLLAGAAAALLMWQLAVGVLGYIDTQRFEAIAAAPNASEAVRARWAKISRIIPVRSSSLMPKASSSSRVWVGVNSRSKTTTSTSRSRHIFLSSSTLPVPTRKARWGCPMF